MSIHSVFDTIPTAPPNSILGLALECKKDTFPNKIDLTIGAYRDESGKPVVLPVVREAEKMIFDAHTDHEYLAQDGLPEFNRGSQILMFGEDSSLIREGKVLTFQALSGTGSLRLGAELLGKFLSSKTCYYPEVTWPNHPTILDECHISKGTYRYLDGTGCNLNFAGLIEDLLSFPDGSVVLFHNCAHNPTGVDPTDDQWREILRVCISKNFLPFFDNAYQGFVSGDVHVDAFAVRLFADAGLPMIVACSFAKNFGLYGERAGALHIVCDRKESLENIASQLRVISRSIYSTCPSYGARIVATVLGNPRMKADWEAQCKAMADRLNSVRKALFDALIRLNVKGTWNHVITQRGMFSYTGIPADVVARLKSDYHIYMLGNGRISLAGLNMSNVERFAEALLTIMGTN
jgi:aspartate/tyrosine/aromatic aminotransferase